MQKKEGQPVKTDHPSERVFDYLAVGERSTFNARQFYFILFYIFATLESILSLNNNINILLQN